MDWAAERAAAKGFADVMVSCEPTGHRWRVQGQLAQDRSMSFGCVQPMQTSWARHSEDLTFVKDGPHYRPGVACGEGGVPATWLGRVPNLDPPMRLVPVA